MPSLSSTTASMATAPKTRPWVYIACPYSIGCREANVRRSIQCWHDLYASGWVWPYNPLLTHYLHMFSPLGYDEWLSYAKAILPKMDACFRILGPSKGADEEVLWCINNARPVFVVGDDLFRWAERWMHRKGIIVDPTPATATTTTTTTKTKETN